MLEIDIGQFTHNGSLIVVKVLENRIFIDGTAVQQWHTMSEEDNGWLLVRTVQFCHLAVVRFDNVSVQAFLNVDLQIQQLVLVLITVFTVSFS